MTYLLSLTILLAPTFAWNFKIGPFPTNFLMVWIAVVWLVFTINLFAKKQLAAFFAFVKNLDTKVLIGVIGFSLAGLISLFIQGIDRQKLGQFIVLFVQPISLFFISAYTLHQNPDRKFIINNSLFVILGLSGAYAIYQYFTLHGLPQVYWGNSQEPKRAVSFFGHPDFYSLFTAPLLAFLLTDLGLKIQDFRKHFVYFGAWILGAAGLLLSLSRAGWVGLAGAIIVYAIFSGNKIIRRLILAGAIAIILIVTVTPNLRYRVLLPFYGEKSAVSRFSLWHTGLKAAKQSPVLGLGLNGFGNNWKSLNTDPNLDTHNFPHNIFLDIWVDLGLIGLISFVWLCGLYIVRGFLSLRVSSRGGPILGGHPKQSSSSGVIPRNASDEESLNVSTTDKGSLHSFGSTQSVGMTQETTGLPHQSAALLSRNDNLKFAITLFLITLLVQGLFDNPYFRNDLALVFWIVLSMIL